MKKLLFLPVLLLLSISLFAQTSFRVDTQQSGRIDYLNIIAVEVDEGVTPSDYMPAVFNQTRSGFVGGMPARSMPFHTVKFYPTGKVAYVNINHFEANGESYWDRGNFIRLPKWGNQYPKWVDVTFSTVNGRTSYRLVYSYE